MVTQMNTIGQIYSLRTCTASRAVERFLVSIRKATVTTFPTWRDVLNAALEDCALMYDSRRAVLDMHPLDDYYFAASVAKEAALIRPLFDAEDALELLAEIAEKVDQVAGRKDRLVSSLVFDIISHLERSNLHPHRQSHDEAIAVLLRRLNIDTTPATKALMDEMLFRHHLGEQLALGVPSWWIPFRAKFVIAKSQALTAVVRPTLPRTHRVGGARSLI